MIAAANHNTFDLKQRAYELFIQIILFHTRVSRTSPYGRDRSCNSPFGNGHSQIIAKRFHHCDWPRFLARLRICTGHDCSCCLTTFFHHETLKSLVQMAAPVVKQHCIDQWIAMPARRVFQAVWPWNGKTNCWLDGLNTTELRCGFLRYVLPTIAESALGTAVLAAFGAPFRWCLALWVRLSWM